MSSVTEAITVALGKQGGMLFGPRRCLLRVRSHGVAPEWLWVKRDCGLKLSVTVIGGIFLLPDYANHKCHPTFETQSAQENHHLASRDFRRRLDSAAGDH